MSFILFLIFLTAPPAAPGKQVWSLHHTEQLEFATKEACNAAAKDIVNAFAKTATTTVRGWCLDRGGARQLLGGDNSLVDRPFATVPKGQQAPAPLQPPERIGPASP